VVISIALSAGIRVGAGLAEVGALLALIKKRVSDGSHWAVVSFKDAAE
jgi:hypothetical protein